MADLGKMLPCGHVEYMYGHCATWGCPRYLNDCARHCGDDKTAVCSNPV